MKLSPVEGKELIKVLCNEFGFKAVSRRAVTSL